MKEFMLISLFVIPCCKAADDQPVAGSLLAAFMGRGDAGKPGISWNQAVQQYMPIENKEELLLSSEQIEAIPANLNLPQLRRLFLIDNQIEAIPANLNLPQLQNLYLEMNRIKTIPANLNLPQLRLLYLSNNWIESIQANLNLPQLQDLYLGNNQLTAIPADLNLPQLEGLYLEMNYIEHIDQNIFTQFPNLKYLNLNENPLTQENIDALREAARLTNRTIAISANKIGSKYANPDPDKSVKPAKRTKKN